MSTRPDTCKPQTTRSVPRRGTVGRALYRVIIRLAEKTNSFRWAAQLLAGGSACIVWCVQIYR